MFQRELDAKGVCVSVKSACSSDGLPSRAVFAVSRDRRNALSSWRISLSHLTTEDEIKEYLAGNLCRCSGYEGQLRGIQAFLAWKRSKEAAE